MRRSNRIQALRLAIALACFSAAVSPALAQGDEGEPTEELLSTDTPGPDLLEQMCSPQGVLQYRFGQLGVPRSSRLEFELGRPIDIPASFLPFTTVKMQSADWSGKFTQVTFTSSGTNDDAASDMILAISETLAGSGWEAIDMQPGQAPLYLAGYDSGTTFVRPAEGEKGTSRVLLALDYIDGKLVLYCGRDDLIRSTALEALGELPAGTPRPVMPEMPAPLPLSEAECADPATAARIQRILEERSLDEFSTAMLSRARWRDRMTQWMIWKLRKSGMVSEGTIARLTFNSLGANLQNNLYQQLGMLKSLAPIIDRIAEADKGGNPADLCRSVVPLQKWVSDVDGLTSKLHETLQAALAQEAADLEVSLD